MPPKTPPKPRRDLGELLLDCSKDGLPLRLVATKDDASLKDLTAAQRAWMEARSWQPKAGSVLLLSDENGAIAGALLGTGGDDWATQSPLLPGALPGALPTGDYRFVGQLPDPELAALAWLAGCYRFGRYKSEANGKPKRLVLPEVVGFTSAATSSTPRPTTSVRRSSKPRRASSLTSMAPRSKSLKARASCPTIFP
jgi:leucyl aminopeptidase